MVILTNITHFNAAPHVFLNYCLFLLRVSGVGFRDALLSNPVKKILIKRHYKTTLLTTIQEGVTVFSLKEMLQVNLGVSCFLQLDPLKFYYLEFIVMLKCC